MADYPLIFNLCLALNVSITFCSSSLFQMAKSYCVGSSAATIVRSDSSDPLMPSSPSKNATTDDELSAIHSKLLTRYLSVYLLATMSDWLQGPYVYALYDSYGFTQHEIAVLFVTGFGSSMLFGSFIGGMADAGGRRKFVVLFCITYAICCMTKHVKDFWVLLLGRILSGVSTSLLFSVFDSWLIRAHTNAKVDKYLSKSFSLATYGNSVIAIVAGLIANKAAGLKEMVPMFSDPTKTDSLVYIGGFIAPFDVSLFALIICGILALFLWEENYAEQKEDDDDIEGDDHGHCTTDSPDSFKCFRTMQEAYTTAIRNRDIMLCGLISSFFEGSMYVFVFMWTPSLTELTALGMGVEREDVHLPFGVIFATFMICCMAGSSVFSIAIQHIRAEAFAIIVLSLATISFALMVFSTSITMTFMGMNAFEMCVGMYFPTMGTMKSSIVPEAKRSAIYNLYRVPLNAIVLLSLLTNLSSTQSFTICMTMLAIAAILQVKLLKSRNNSDPKHVQSNKMEKKSSPPIMMPPI